MAAPWVRADRGSGYWKSCRTTEAIKPGRRYQYGVTVDAHVLIARAVGAEALFIATVCRLIVLLISIAEGQVLSTPLMHLETLIEYVNVDRTRGLHRTTPALCLGTAAIGPTVAPRLAPLLADSVPPHVRWVHPTSGKTLLRPISSPCTAQLAVEIGT